MVSSCCTSHRCSRVPGCCGAARCWCWGPVRWWCSASSGGVAARSPPRRPARPTKERNGESLAAAAGRLGCRTDGGAGAVAVAPPRPQGFRRGRAGTRCGRRLPVPAGGRPARRAGTAGTVGRDAARWRAGVAGCTQARPAAGRWLGTAGPFAGRAGQCRRRRRGLRTCCRTGSGRPRRAGGSRTGTCPGRPRETVR
ncbi:hypothetical protein G6F57_019026 [Rhizopus arrhizus]|nr:hypothetical protein G6F57_019026 [Rhizopus arrhizus]